MAGSTYIYRTVTQIRVVVIDPTGKEELFYCKKFNQNDFLKTHPGYKIKNIDKKLIRMKLSMAKFMEYAEKVD